jgi:CheY-like chemotaxis protein
MRNARIMVVEDESILALGIQSKLESFGYVVSALVTSGA